MGIFLLFAVPFKWFLNWRRPANPSNEKAAENASVVATILVALVVFGLIWASCSGWWQPGVRDTTKDKDKIATEEADKLKKQIEGFDKGTEAVGVAVNKAVASIDANLDKRKGEIAVATNSAVNQILSKVEESKAVPNTNLRKDYDNLTPEQIIEEARKRGLIE